ncbi:hypothetical protein C8Q80DRAFT_1118270 [Daedaleopsis nitida]|nr:hypothetical protein C8Q80DRAFT_1118270 [Daedaleopsis nitida]
MYLLEVTETGTLGCAPLDRTAKHTYMLRELDGTPLRSTIHGDRLKLFYYRPDNQSPTSSFNFVLVADQFAIRATPSTQPNLFDDDGNSSLTEWSEPYVTPGLWYLEVEIIPVPRMWWGEEVHT